VSKFIKATQIFFLTKDTEIFSCDK